MAALIAGLGSGGTCFGLHTWMRQEIKKRTDVRQCVIDCYKEDMEEAFKTVKEQSWKIGALIRDLKDADRDCQYCAKSAGNGGLGLEKCLEMENSEACTLDCKCHGCRGNSNWEWRGMTEENTKEE